MTKNSIILLVIVIVIIIFGGAYFSLKNDTSVKSDNSMSVEHTDSDDMDKNSIMAIPSPDGSESIVDEMIVDNKTIDNSEVKVFNVSGVNFSFLAPEIKVKKGDRVKIIFSSEEGFHDWVVDEFNARTTQISAGNTTSVEFVASQKGNFEYYCSVGQHRAQGMVGQLIVE